MLQKQKETGKDICSTFYTSWGWYVCVDLLCRLWTMRVVVCTLQSFSRVMMQ